MGSIEENRYRYSIDTLAKVSIISILVSILRYPSENPHHKLHIHKLGTYFDIFYHSDFEFFRFLRHLPHFCPISGYSTLDFFLAFWVTIWTTISNINTKIRYRYSTILKGIDTVSMVSILFPTTTTNQKQKVCEAR